MEEVAIAPARTVSTVKHGLGLDETWPQRFLSDAV